MTSATFDPTPTAPQMVEWLDLATRLQLERDLADLPTLAEMLERNYDALLAKGDRDPRDSAVRYVVRFDTLDLADRRTKWEHSASRTEPLTLADRDVAGPTIDPVWWADMARRLGARRQGILPTLAAWVSLTAGEMHDRGAWHFEPADPDRIVWVASTSGEVHATKPGPTVASEAGWLLRHIDWICGQQSVIELADEVRRIVADLDSLGVSLHGPDHASVGTVNELAESTGIPAATIFQWARDGWLTVVSDKRPRTYMRTEVLALRKTYGVR